MAALASSPQQPAPVHQLTPPSSSHGTRGAWEFAVPVNYQTTLHDQEEPYMSEYTAPTHPPRQPLTSQANGYAKPVRSNTWDLQGQAYENDQSHFAPDHSRELQKKSSRNMSLNSNDQDGVMEYYKSQANHKRGPTAVKGKPKKKPTKSGPQDPNWAAIEHDQNNWIHRDKLKEIEIREMEELGYRVGRGSRPNSRSQSASRASRRSRDRRGSEATDQNQSGDDRPEPRKVVSPIPAEDEEDQEPHNSWSPPTQEEFAPDDQPTSPRHTVRPSTSRIPLPKTGGLPVPATVADRDATLPRSRASSDNWSGDATAVNGARVRSGSVGSQVLLDGPDDERQVTPPYDHTRKTSSGGGTPPKSPPKSPMKAKAAAKPAPASAARKTAQKIPPKNRQLSITRPGTSGGSASRPTTSHRPEGEAPWLATMYKPDPRLPPDQQIIPTHAKRMQQQQWENQGRTGSMYDKDFRLLNTDEIKDKRLSQIDPIELEIARENERDNGEWPLPSPTIQTSFENEKSDTNTSKSPTNDATGYKLTPTIPQSSRIPSPIPAPPVAPAADASAPNTTRLPEPAEDAKEKKGCCCIVM